MFVLYEGDLGEGGVGGESGGADGEDGAAGGGGLGASCLPHHEGDEEDHLLLLHLRRAVPQGLPLGLRLWEEVL